MTMRSLGLSVLAAAGLMLGAAGCEQRRVACAVRSDDFTAKYTEGKVTAGSGDCDKALSVEAVGFFTHVPALSPAGKISSISVRPSGTGVIAQAADTIVDLPDPKHPGETIPGPVAVDKVATHKPAAVGAFSTLFPDAQNICVVPTLSAAEVQFDTFTVPGDEPPPPDVDGGTDGATEGGVPDGGAEAGVEAGVDASAEAGVEAGVDASGDAVASDVKASEAAAETAAPVDAAAEAGDQPPPMPPVTYEATHVRYDWSNVRIYVTAASTGSVVSADVTYTTFNGDTQACKATYKVRAISPMTSCADEHGKPDVKLCDDVPIASEALPADTQYGCESPDPTADEPEYFCVLVDSPKK